MLKTIDPHLNADVLYALRAMGHGDRLVICDTNFPADAIGTYAFQTVGAFAGQTQNTLANQCTFSQAPNGAARSLIPHRRVAPRGFPGRTNQTR